MYEWNIPVSVSKLTETLIKFYSKFVCKFIEEYGVSEVRADVRLEVNDMNNDLSFANKHTHEFYNKYGYRSENKFIWHYFNTKEPKLIVII